MIGESQLNLSSEKILVRGARQVITLQGPDGPRRGAALSELGMIRDGALLLEGGKVLQMGPSRRLENVAAARGAREINAAGRVVIPGFVDCRMQPLIPIAKPGPPGSLAPDAPFWRSLEELAALPSGRLQARVQTMLARMVRHGTTTASPGVIPAPSRSAAAKLLRIFAGADSRPMSIIPALCLTRSLPAGHTAEQESEIEPICHEWLPAIAHRSLARLVELDCDAFKPPAARRCLELAAHLGFGLRVRAGVSTAALRLALEGDAVSLISGDLAPGEIAALAGSQTTVLLSPSARPLPARDLIDGGVAIALTSGFGFEHASTYNMQMVIALACSEMGMSPAEAISAATINSACALGCGDRCGSLQPGKHADLIMANVEDYRDIARQFGVNHVHMVVKNGAIIYQEGEVAGCGR